MAWIRRVFGNRRLARCPQLRALVSKSRNLHDSTTGRHMSGSLRRRSAGFSVTEIIVVLAIIAILGAVVFAAMSPARAKSRYASCSNGMRQMYVASMTYGADHDGELLYPELNGGAYARSLFVMRDYGVPRQMYWCPSCPAGSYEHLASTYAFAPYGFNDVPLGTRGDGPTKRDRIIQKWRAEGAAYLFIRCPVHDQLEHWPNNQNRQANPFVLGVKADGSLYSGFHQSTGRYFPLKGIAPNDANRISRPPKDPK